MANLRRKKALASKKIIDAAGGKLGESSGYAGQGGYFGAALRTAFRNGELSEKLKNEKFRASTMKQIKDSAFKKGEKKGEKKGIQIGEKKELPKAVAKAEQMLEQKKKTAKKAAVANKQAAEDAALKNQAEAEASKVRAAVKASADKAGGKLAVVDDVAD